ncbi:MAG: peptide/nickel transport system ATP-binding protein ddpF, partial [Actinomycetota bacterium]|nr:peptide/nickel transport system ATP-binding protein ddpF [Actinomycetota bacterium]
AVLHASAHPYSVGLMRSRLTLSSSKTRPLATLQGEVPYPAAPPPGCPFEPRCELRIDECSTAPPDPTPVTTGHDSACIRSAALLVGAVAIAVGPTEESFATSSGGNVMPEDQPPAVQVSGLVKSYTVKSGRRGRTKLTALRGLDLTVAEGEAVGIVGESGSGKSTLLRVIAGLERADRGSVTLGRGPGPQMVFQDAGASLTPWLTVGELVGERLRKTRMSGAQRRERVAAALTQVGLLPDVARAKAGQLSGGQRQRVALARATVVPPEVLLCDEPTSALDVSLAASVINLVGRLRRELNMAVMFVTHDLSVARIVADRIAVMYLGQIVEIGTADGIVNRPRHPYTKALVAALPSFGAEPLVLAGEPASPLSPPSGCAFHPRCPIAEPVCSDPELVVRLQPLPDDTQRRAACIRRQVI